MKWLKSASLHLVFLWLISVSSYAELQPYSDSPEAKKYVAILVGASADKESANAKRELATNLRQSLLNDYGYDAKRITVLLGNDKKTQIGSDGVCNASNIRQLFSRYQKNLTAADQLTVVLIGHGTGRRESAKFNVVGPDLTVDEFAELFSVLPNNDVVVINTTSSSHDFTRPLAKPGRILISATRSGAEKYDTVFPYYFIEGVTGLAADRDKNGRVSYLELFTYSTNRVNEHYRERDILPSEHATLEDNGDGVFSMDLSRQGDGRLAELAYLDQIQFSLAELSPQAGELREQMKRIERDVFSLRAAKPNLSESDYWQQLEPLLIQLAKVTRDYNALVNEN
ncbi:hypothetical protein NBRC116494_20980 [Aurantivibrio plasticivorans]